MKPFIFGFVLLSDGHGTADGLVGGGVGAADRKAVGGGVNIAGDGLFGRGIIAGHVDGNVAAAGGEQAGQQEGYESFFHFFVFLSFLRPVFARAGFVMFSITANIVTRNLKTKKPTVGF
jgi:hypothetical protein